MKSLPSTLTWGYASTKSICLVPHLKTIDKVNRSPDCRPSYHWGERFQLVDNVLLLTAVWI